MDLVEHYRAQMTLHYLPVRYEDIVDDQESAVRRMLDFIGEPFDGSARTARGIRPTDCFARDRTEAGMR